MPPKFLVSISNLECPYLNIATRQHTLPCLHYLEQATSQFNKWQKAAYGSINLGATVLSRRLLSKDQFRHGEEKIKEEVPGYDGASNESGHVR